MHQLFKTIVVISSILLTQLSFAFDHQHSQWHSILQKNVLLTAEGYASTVDYKKIKKDRSDLNAYLHSLSSVKEHDFKLWSKNKQKAFLINAYNAFTIQLILNHYPEIKSIKEIGSFFTNPWKIKFFVLLNNKTSLDNIEHSMLRKKGVYDDPFIHVALVCASISCPALINEAYTDKKIEHQLINNMRSFLSDNSRNRYNIRKKSLEVSKIFDWYEEDFTKGYREIYSLKDLFSRYSIELTNDKDGQNAIRSKKIDINYLDYNWDLNDSLSHH
jgi:hypothetical protein